MGFITNDKSKSHLKYIILFVLSLENWYKSKNLNNGPKYGGSSSTRLTVNACCQNVWSHQQTNAHGHIVFTIANSNISYCINVISVEWSWEEISSHASGLAILHLEYFVANLVWNFEWKAVDGDEVDLSEKLQFTMEMMNPLKAHLSLRL